MFTFTSSAHRLAATFAAAAGVALVAPSLGAATTGRVIIRTPPYPIFALSAYGSIWVGTHHSNTIYRIDPRTNRVATQVTDSRTPCAEATAGFGSIYVPDCIDEGGGTVQISARTNRPVRTLAGGSPVIAYGSLWLLSPDGSVVRRVDPQSAVTIARIPTNLNEGTGGGQEYLGTAGADSVWLGSQTTKTVVRISAATNRISDVIPLPGAAAQAAPGQGYAAATQMAFADGKVWLGNPAGVYELDPATNTAKLLPIKIGNLDFWGDITFAVGAGSVWVRNSGATVTRIDPATGDVRGTYPAGGGGGGLAVAYDSLWIANAATDTTWRETVHQDGPAAGGEQRPQRPGGQSNGPASAP